MVESILELRDICQKSYPKEHIELTQKVYRKFSIYVTKLFLYMRLSGNQATLIHMLSGFTAGLCLVFRLNIIGAILLQLWYLLDLVDGEVARYRGEQSMTGSYFDRVSHYITHPFFFICLSFVVYNTLLDVRVFIFGFSAAISVMLIDLVGELIYSPIVLTYMKSHGLDVKTSTSTLSNFVKLLPIRVPGLTNVISATAFLDVFFNLFSGWNFMYIVVILYGTFVPFLWIILVVKRIKTKSVDEVHDRLFGERRK